MDTEEINNKVFNYQSLNIFLENKKIILKSFKKHIKKILDDIDEGEYNIKMLNDLTDLISKYYKKYESDSDDDKSSNSDEKEDIITLDKLSDSEEQDNNPKINNLNNNQELPTISKNNTEKITNDVDFINDDSEEKINNLEKKENINSPKVPIKTEILFESFMNDTQENKKPMVVKPEYDTIKNVNTFIKNSFVY